MVSFPQVSPLEPCAHLSPPPYAPHLMPIISLCNSKLFAAVQLLLCISQQPTTNTYLQPAESILHLISYVLKNNFNIILIYIYIYTYFQNKIMYAFLISLNCTACSVRPIIFDQISLIKISKEYSVQANATSTFVARTWNETCLKTEPKHLPMSFM